MAEANLIKSANLARSREIDFTYRFNDSIKKLLEMLGTTRKERKVAGTVLKAYKATGTLHSGSVAEGDTIPLSQYQTEAVPFDEITLNKWRKATSAEAIIEKGWEQAVNMTTDRMLKDCQKKVKNDFISFLANGTGRAIGTDFQSTIAQIWGKLETAYEDTEYSPVYFVNQNDASDYLGTATVSLQQAFGLTYIENFLGMGTVVFSNTIPKGTVYGTAKENIVLYYVDVNDDDLSKAFEFTADETGLIGIHESADYTNLTSSDTVMCGIVLFAERIDGIIVGTISGAYSIELDKTSASVDVADTVALTATVLPSGTTVTWASSDTSVATVSNGTVTGVAAGSAVITATAGNAIATCVVTVAAV